ncbi:MAG: DUF4292 domain-containing protein [Chitinophagaceae bacterium]|jgi:hypothetical protein|nr:DUF4292 domain-containing protein [Chitinophagaceae bacterium]
MKQIIFFISLVLVFFIACKPASKIAVFQTAIAKKDTSKIVVVNPDATADSLAIINSIRNTINATHIDYTTFSAKMKLDYQTQDDGKSGTINVRMKKDSVIWISVTGTALNIEVLRVLITTDSITIMDKIKKTVQQASIMHLQEVTELPVSFPDLQDFLVGNAIHITGNILSYKSNNDKLQVSLSGEIFKNLLTIDTINKQIFHSKLDDDNSFNHRTCDITYEDFDRLPANFFPKSRQITVSEKSRLDINLQVKQYNFDQDLTYPFSIPKKYKWIQESNNP